VAMVSPLGCSPTEPYPGIVTQRVIWVIYGNPVVCFDSVWPVMLAVLKFRVVTRGVCGKLVIRGVAVRFPE
jgi:hypothetical protein